VLPETPVDVVVGIMAEKKVGSVIMAENEKWTGIFTERDLVKRVLAPRRGLETTMAEVASTPLVTAEPGIFGREAAGTMAMHGFKRLPLWLDGEGVGIVTARDIVEAFAHASTPRAPRVDWMQWN
jgi:CBS domain-containing protein